MHGWTTAPRRSRGAHCMSEKGDDMLLQPRDWRGRYAPWGDYTQIIGVRVTNEDHQALRQLAEEQGRSMSALLRDLLHALTSGRIRLDLADQGEATADG